MFLLFAKHVGDGATFPFGHKSVMKSIMNEVVFGPL